jgi:hypothetical protein
MTGGQGVAVKCHSADGRVELTGVGQLAEAPVGQTHSKWSTQTLLALDRRDFDSEVGKKSVTIP